LDDKKYNYEVMLSHFSVDICKRLLVRKHELKLKIDSGGVPKSSNSRDLAFIFKFMQSFYENSHDLIDSDL